MDDFFHADISVGSVCGLEQRTSEAISEAVEEAREYVKEQPVVHMDETGWREANKKAWLWVAATSVVTVFLIRCVRRMPGNRAGGETNTIDARRRVTNCRLTSGQSSKCR